MLSEHFERSEFACKCGCGQDTVDYELVRILEAIHDKFQTVVTVNSGNRCEKYNHKVGGKPNSQHLKGRAADITVRGKTPKEVQDAFEQMFPDSYGMGRYANFTHVDSRAGKARW